MCDTNPYLPPIGTGTCGHCGLWPVEEVVVYLDDFSRPHRIVVCHGCCRDLCATVRALPGLTMVGVTDPA